MYTQQPITCRGCIIEDLARWRNGMYSNVLDEKKSFLERKNFTLFVASPRGCVFLLSNWFSNPDYHLKVFASLFIQLHTVFFSKIYYRSKLSKILFIYRYPTWDTRRIEILSNSRSLPLLFVFHSFLSIYLSFFFLTENRSFQGMFLHGVFLPEQVQRFNGWNRVTKDMDVFWKV